jgi:hypothetical protein
MEFIQDPHLDHIWTAQSERGTYTIIRKNEGILVGTRMEKEHWVTTFDQNKRDNNPVWWEIADDKDSAIINCEIYHTRKETYLKLEGMLNKTLKDFEAMLKISEELMSVEQDAEAVNELDYLMKFLKLGDHKLRGSIYGVESITTFEEGTV